MHVFELCEDETGIILLKSNCLLFQQLGLYFHVTQVLHTCWNIVTI